MSQATFNHTGTRRTCFSVSPSSTSATLVYSGNANDRELLIQNTNSTYKVWLATFSINKETAASGGSRMVLRANSDLWTDNTDNLYGIIEAGGSSVELVGCLEYESKDR